MTSPTLLSLADRCEKLTESCRETDLAIHLALWLDGDLAKITKSPRGLEGQEGYSWDIKGGSVVFERWNDDNRCPFNGGYPLPAYTASLDAIRSLGGMVVFASDIGADGLAMVKIVIDTSTSPIVEHTGIAPQLQHAWLAAALRARSALEASRG